MKIRDRKLMTMLFALFLFVFGIFGISPVTVSAVGDLPRLVDMADLLSDSEEAALAEMLDEVSERQQVDIVVVTADSLEGKSATQYADDFYDDYGYGFGDGRDGILFLVSMGERDWCLSTTGFGITAFTDAGQAYMSELFLPDLSEGDYAAAFVTFVQLCDDFITQADSGAPYDVGNLPQEPYAFGMWLAISFGVAFVIALIATGVMKGQLHSVSSQSRADSYIRDGSMQLTKNNDLFLYRHIERREKPKDNSSDSPGGSSTHTSSSGTTHGGSGGKF